MGFFYSRFFFRLALLVSAFQVAYSEQVTLPEGVSRNAYYTQYTFNYVVYENSVPYAPTSNYPSAIICAYNNQQSTYWLFSESGPVVSMTRRSAPFSTDQAWYAMVRCVDTGSANPQYYDYESDPRHPSQQEPPPDPPDPNDPADPYTNEQCESFAEGTDTEKTLELLDTQTCYKGCSVQAKGFGGTYWSVGSLNFNQHNFTGGTCTSIEPEDSLDCFNYLDNYGNYTQICVPPPEYTPGDFPEIEPPLSDPETCVVAYDAQGDFIREVCGSEPGNACWFENGQFYCAGETYGQGFGCTRINGLLACSVVDPETGLKTTVNPDSVDHPANGGNADGFTDNDVFSPDTQGNVPGGG